MLSYTSYDDIKQNVLDEYNSFEVWFIDGSIIACVETTDPNITISYNFIPLDEEEKVLKEITVLNSSYDIELSEAMSIDSSKSIIRFNPNKIAYDYK